MAILTIKDLSKDSQQVFDVLNKETDLACVLIATSYLDEILKSLLQSHFRKGDLAKSLLSASGALGTFARRRNMAYCLTLISKKKYDDLKIIENIRNHFAHSHLMLSFSESKLIELTNNLSFCDILLKTHLYKEVENPTEQETKNNARNRFNFTVVLLGQELLVSGLGPGKTN